MMDITAAIQDRVTHVAYLISQAQGPSSSGREQENWNAAQSIVTEELLEKMAQMKSTNCFSDSPLDQAIQEKASSLAYNNAANRGFAPGHSLDDWVQALRQVEGEVSAIINTRLTPQRKGAQRAVPA